MTSSLKLVDGPNVNQAVFNRPVYNGIIITINQITFYSDLVGGFKHLVWGNDG
jgi:hypothetical protein